MLPGEMRLEIAPAIIAPTPLAAAATPADAPLPAQPRTPDLPAGPRAPDVLRI